MGTNFSAKIIPSEKDKYKMRVLINEESFEELREFLNDVLTEIHLCKRSGGSSIAFDHNWGKYYKPSRESLDEFLSKPDIQIIDEYGQPFTKEEFWSMIDNWNKIYKESDFKHDEYYYSNKKDIQKCWDIFHIDTKGRLDFVSEDGLRFLVFTDFC